jgi:prephenate dehydrogenase
MIDLLGRARDSLDWDNSVAELVEAGHAARTRYDRFPRSDIFTVVIGAENWREELAAAGRAGGVIRSALPIRDSPR